MILLFALMTAGLVAVFALLIFIDNLIRGRRDTKKAKSNNGSDEKSREKKEN